MALNIAAIQALQGGPSPFQRTIQGFQLGQQQRQAELEARQAQADLQAKQERQLATRTALSELAGKENPTGQDFARIMIDFPEVAEQLKQPFEIMGAQEREIATTNARNVFSAIESGNIDVARTLLEDQRDAARNSGDEQEAVGAEIILKALDADPGSALAAAGLAFSAATGPEEFENTLSELRARGSVRRIGELEKQKLAADIGLTNAQIATATKGLEEADVKTQKLAFELEALQSGDQLIPIEKKFDFEDKLRDEFVKRTADSTKIEDAFRTVESAEDSAAGDLALIFAFMKMLDPGSTVREGEFATAQNTTGIGGRILNAYNKALTGERLNPTQRKEFTAQAKSTLKSSKKRISEVRSDLEFPIERYGLNRENVFGTKATAEEVAPLVETDASTLSDADLDAEIARLQAQQ